MAKRDDVDELIADLKKMAERVGAVFVPDPEKIKAFRKGRRNPTFVTR
jgi:hypothetical protein